LLIQTNLANAAAVGVIASLLLSMLIILTQRWHGMLTDDLQDGVQKLHTGSISRVGGLGILLGFAAVTLLVSSANTLVTMLLLAVLPAWFFGFAEDITKRVSTRVRLLATMASALMAWWLTGYALYWVDIPLIDDLLALTPIAVIFTVFAVAGLANAINLIDGINGLASGTVLICLTALGWVASDQQNAQLLELIVVVMAVTLGFFLLNYPAGKIFLGDGGAYMLGFFLAWVAVILVADGEKNVSPWAPLLICAYPILETLFSMSRRLQNNRRMDHPDRTHLHSLVFRRVVPRLFPKSTLKTRNALTAPFLWLFAAVPALAGCYWYDNTFACIAAFCIMALVYFVLHRRLTRFNWFR
jgi:UDP-N-acetylmuramyl pentapeptide phosphotransferase/UDP-N-acetylglucosamine-1-phosphate transferase